MTNAPIRILFVDDNDRVTSAWSKLIALQPDMKLVGTLSSCGGLSAFIAEHQTDVVLLDLTMEGADPIDAIGELRTARPEVRVLVYSGMNDRETMRRAREAGAHAFLSKLDDPSQILEEVRRAASPNSPR